MKDIKKIYCIKISVREDIPLKIKNIKVEDEDKQSLAKDSNQILKCGEFCDSVFCENDDILDNINTPEASDFKNSLK